MPRQIGKLFFLVVWSTFFPTSALSRVDRFEFDSSVINLHLPIDSSLRGVHVIRPSGGFRLESLDIREAST